ATRATALWKACCAGPAPKKRGSSRRLPVLHSSNARGVAPSWGVGSPSPDQERVARRRAVSPVLRAEDFRPLSSSVQVEFGAHSDGRPRNAPNDDHYLIVRLGRSQETIATSLAEGHVPQRFMEYGYAMFLADGIAASAGGLASRIAVSTLVHLALHYGRWNVRVDSRAAFEITERLDWCYRQAYDLVKARARGNRRLHGMATKLTA